MSPDHSVTRTSRRAVFETLAPLVDLVSRLRRLAELERPGNEPDVDRLVTEISHGRLPPHLPRRPKRGLGAGLHVVQDLSSRLTPYRLDQGLLSLELKDLLPKTAITLSTVRDDNLQPYVHWPEQSRGVLQPPPESTVLVLGDLGVLSRRPERLTAAWCALGERLAERYVDCAALVPCSADTVPDELARVWSILPWDRSRQAAGHRSREALEGLAGQLLGLLAFAVAIEPRLLRRVRRAVLYCGRDSAGPGLV